MGPLARVVRQVVEDRGWRPGSSLENSVALLLHSHGLHPVDLVQQFRVGKYKLDFAATTVKMAIEVDGPHHCFPETAAKDVLRDSYLRSLGWVIFRVDNQHGEDSLAAQVSRVVRLLRAEWGRPRP